MEIICKVGNWGYILNLGYGVLKEIFEENVEFFFKMVKEISSLLVLIV